MTAWTLSLSKRKPYCDQIGSLISILILILIQIGSLIPILILIAASHGRRGGSPAALRAAEPPPHPPLTGAELLRPSGSQNAAFCAQFRRAAAPATQL